MLPALLLSVPVAAFAGLTVLSAAPGPGGFDQLVVAEPAPTPPALDLLALPQPLPTPSTAATQPPTSAPKKTKARPKVAKPSPKPTATPQRTAEPRPQRASRSGSSRTSTTATRSTATRSTSSSSSGSSRSAVCPVDGRHSFSDTWGAARSGGRSHQGTDMMAAHGTRLVATVSGTVRTASSSNGGISLYLRGDNGDTYFYAHNSRNVVSSGQRVRAGQLVGYVGSTGNADASAPHLHFERHPGGGSAVNPYSYLRSVCG